MSQEWTPQRYMNCTLFPLHCPYMGEGLKSLLAATLETFAPESFDAAKQPPQAKKCEGDCEACSLPDWMKNC